MKKVHFTKQTKLAKQLMFVAVTALTFQSCIKDNFDTNKIAEVKWNPNFAVPLVYSSLSMENMLKNAKDFLHTENDGSLTLVYTANVASLDASSIATLKLPDQPAQNITILTAPITGPIPGGGAVMPVQTQTVTFAGAVASTIDSIFFKGGTFDFSFSSDIPNNVAITITIPGAKKNGVPFSKTIALNYTGAPTTTASPSYSLTGYDFDMTEGGTTSNTFIVQYAITVSGSGTLLGTEQVQIGAAMNNLLYSKFFGNLGQQTITVQPDTIPISIFKNALSGGGSFTLANPKIKLITYNSFGIPLTATLPELSGESSTGTIYPIPNSLPYTITVLSPNMSQVGQSISHTDSLTAGNSHLVSVISNTPKNIIYSVNAQTNAGAASQSNFVLDTSRIKLDMEVNLPLDGTASNFTLVDTLPFSALDNQNISDNVSSAVFRVSTSNGFPLDVNMQVYFVDSLYTKLDSLIVPTINSSLIIKSGPIDATTKRVVTAGVANEDITIDRAKLKKLSTTKKLIIQAKASTTNSGNQEVRIYSDYKLEVKLGVQIQVEAKFNPNKK